MRPTARSLRRNQTEAERIFWNRVRDRRLSGYKFRRQHPMGPFIVDFVCLDGRLIVELDGGQHADNVEEDGKRSLFLESQGYRVLRFWNNEVFENMEGVLQTVLSVLNEESRSPSPRPSPPFSGERGKTKGPCKGFGGEGE